MPNDQSPLTQSILAKIAAVPAEPPPDERYRSAILNSALAAWHSRQTIAAAHANPDDHNPPQSAERIPIPQISVAEQRPFIRLAAEILAAKRADAAADTRELEWRLDELVYGLYGLTEAESLALERSLGMLPRGGPLSKAVEPKGRETVVGRGKAIYDEKIRNWAEPAQKGKFAVIDVHTGDYEIDASHTAALKRLVERHPDVIAYTARIGYPAAFKMGARSWVVKR